MVQKTVEAAMQVCCVSAGENVWQVTNLNNILADFWRFPVARLVMAKSLPLNSEFGEEMKFMAPIEAATKQAPHSPHSAPFAANATTPPSAVSVARMGAATKTGLVHNLWMAQKSITPKKLLSRAAMWWPISSHVEASCGSVSWKSKRPMKTMLPLCSAANSPNCTNVITSTKPERNERRPAKTRTRFCTRSTRGPPPAMWGVTQRKRGPTSGKDCPAAAVQLASGFGRARTKMVC
mmetsp:Transcript_126918/g.353410  ORF Transcript_126918/g.353410 Transcript_126918/m.353410 type:complete len:236 (+) Transcript_126918:304-1011(+)